MNNDLDENPEELVEYQFHVALEWFVMILYSQLKISHMDDQDLMWIFPIEKYAMNLCRHCLHIPNSLLPILDQSMKQQTMVI